MIKKKSGRHGRLEEESNIKEMQDIQDSVSTQTKKITHIQNLGLTILYKNTNTSNSPFLGFS